MAQSERVMSDPVRQGMLDYIREALSRRKGQWREIADASDVAYDTVSKIARGVIPEPGVLKCERLEATLRALDEADRLLAAQQHPVPLTAPVS